MSNHLRRSIGKKNTRRPARSRLALQWLEDRLAPANFVVSNAMDDLSPGSLRGAIGQANAAAGPDTITFSSLFDTPQTITLNGTELSITDSLTITGPGAAGTAPTTIISASGFSRAISIENATAVLNVTLSGLIVQDGVISTVADGAGVFTSDEAVTFERMIIRDNSIIGTVTTRSGAGVAAASGVANLAAGASALIFRNCTISGNSTSGRGGGVYLMNSGSLLMENCTVSGNTSRNTANGGGGVYFRGTPGPAGVTIRNSTFQGNATLLGSGGGIQFYFLNGSVSIQNCTISGNSSGTTSAANGAGGGGIANRVQVAGQIGTINIQSSIVSGNTADVANGRDDIAVQPTSIVTVDHSAIGNTNGFTYVDNGTNRPVGIALNLGQLQDNGGPTLTMAVPAGSPAVDTGANTAPTLLTDQRGHVRAQGAGVDIGAYELDSVVVPPTATASGLVNITSAAAPATYSFQVTYGSTGTTINTGTLDNNDLQITRTGFTTNATRGTIDSSNPNSVIVNYSFTAPGNSWDLADNGTYTISVVAGQVADSNGTAVPAGPIGSFQAIIAGTYHVTTINDSGPGSLREAITLANELSTADSIVFDAPVFGTNPAFIVLSAVLPPINQPLTITGSGAGLLTIRREAPAATQFRILTVLAGATISGITVTGGETEGTVLGTRGGGGISVAGGASLTVTDSIITGNVASGEGGGFYVGAGGTLIIRNSTVSGNTAGTNPAALYRVGGGIYMRDGGTLLVDSCTISGNTTPTNGGGIYLFGNAAPPSNFQILNSTIVGNTAGSNGGGIHFDSPAGTHVVTIQSSTIVGNTALATGAGQGGGGISNDGVNTLNIFSTVVAFNNTAVAGSPAPDVFGTVNATNSLVRDQTGATVNDGGNNLNAGTDPLFVGGATPTLTNNGGPTATIALQAGSTLINAGQATLPGIPFDQRGPGFSRVVGAASDIGAFEVQGATPPPTVLTAQVNGGLAQRSRVTTLPVTFSTAVTFAGAVANAFTLRRNSDNAIVNFTATTSVNGLGQTVVTLDNFVPGTANITEFGSLADGNYTLTTLANQVSAGGVNMAVNDTFGDVVGDNFFRFYGDITGDRRVDIADFSFFSPAYLQGTGANNPVLDYNQDGRIDIADFSQFSVRYFTTLP